MESNWHDTGGVREREQGAERGVLCASSYITAAAITLSALTQVERGMATIIIS